MSVPVATRQPGLPYVLFVCTMVQACHSWMIFIMPPLAVKIAGIVGVDPIYVGYQLSIIFIANFAMNLYSGAAVARLGPVRSLQVLMGMGLLGLVLYATNTIAGIVAGSVLLGLAHIFINPATAILLRKKSPSGRSGLVFSVKQASVPVGFMLASLVGPAVAERFDWRWSLLPLAVMVVLLILATQRLMDSMGQPSGEERILGMWNIPANAVRSAFSNRPLLLCACGAFCFGMTQNAVMGFSSNMFVGEFGWTLLVAGYMVTCANVGAICGRIAWGHLADSLRNPGMVMRLLGVLIAFCGMAMAFMPMAGTLSWGVLYVLIGFVAVGWNGLIMSELSSRIRGPGVEQQTAGALSVLFCSGFIGPLLFTVAYPLVGSYTTIIAIFMVLFGLLGCLCIHLAHDPVSIPKASSG